MSARGENHNIAGSNRRKIVTAYRKDVIYIATVLKLCGPLKIKQIKELGGSKKLDQYLTVISTSGFAELLMQHMN